MRNGGKAFSYAHIPEYQETEKKLKQIQEKYKTMFLAKESGNTLANVTEDGKVLPLPKITYRKSSIILKKKSYDEKTD